MTTPSIPFTLPEIHGGFTEIKGALFLDEEFLVFEIEQKTLGIKNKRKTIKIEPKAILSISLRQGLLRDKICIRPKAPDLLSALPGDHLGEVCVRTWRTRRHDAMRMVDKLESLLDA